MAIDPQQLELEHLKMELEQLKLLFDYTKFHIGIYATLIAALVAAREYWPGSTPHFLKGTLTAFIVAGAAGGVVASNIPAFTSYSAFTSGSIGVWWFQMKGDNWVHVEHAAFWLGILWAVGNVLVGPAKRERSPGFTPPAPSPGAR
jgi:hypothetical protein